MAHYAIEITADDNDTFLITCPALPELTTFADTLTDVATYATKALDEALAARLSRFEDLPLDSAGVHNARPSLLISLKVALIRALKENGQTRADLVRSLGWQRNQVDRLFQPQHSTRLDQFDAAFKALGKVPVVELE